MNPDQNLVFWCKAAFYNCHVVLGVNIAFVDYHPKIPVCHGEISRRRPLYKAFRPETIANKVRDRRDFETMLLGKPLQIGESCHIAIIFHYLANNRGGFQPRKPCKINRTLRMPRPYKNPAPPGDERKHVTRTDKILRSCILRDRKTYSRCPVISRDSRCNPASRINWNRKCRILGNGAIFWFYCLKVKPIGIFLCNGKAY